MKNQSTAGKLAKLNSVTAILNYSMGQQLTTMHQIQSLGHALRKAKDEGKTDMDYDFSIKAQQDSVDSFNRQWDKVVKKLHSACEDWLNYMDGCDALNEDDIAILNPMLELLQDKRDMDL